MTTTNPGRHSDALLSVGQAAERLGTPIRFVRRLVGERRILYVGMTRGRHAKHA